MSVQVPASDWGLTSRQEQILALIADEALTSKEIAYNLGLSFKTVEVHIDRARERIGARNRMQAVLMWDRARRAIADAEKKLSDDAEWNRQRRGMVHCPTCGGFGFVRAAA